MQSAGRRAVARIARARITQSRALSATCIRQAASNFAMPAMSPTMTEGNIASWKVAEGAAYTAGDVILEIETDKATMDVEAQEDGILAKILVKDGSKAVQVGTPIAVMAEEGDDLASLEMPEQAPAPSQSNVQSNVQKTDSAVEKPIEMKEKNAPTPQASTHHTYDKLTNKDGSPLLPSVVATMRKFGITDIKGMKPTGPRGRLLKGDVLAFADKISKDAPVQLQKAIEKRSKLDLSNIKKAVPVKQEQPAAVAEAVEEDKIVELTRRVDLSELILLAEKLSSDARVEVSVEQLASRAAQRALQDVPAFGLAERSSEDVLFDEVLGHVAEQYAVYEPEPLERPTESRKLDVDATECFQGSFIELPRNTATSSVLSLQAEQESQQEAIASDYDIFDFLADKPQPTVREALPRASSTSSATMLASLHFKEGTINTRTASIYLDRVSQYIESPVHLML